MRKLIVPFIAVVAVAFTFPAASQASPVRYLGTQASPDDVTVQPDGRVLVGGVGLRQHTFILRLDVNGELDETFGDHGIVYDGSGYGQPKLALQSDGKILALEGGKVRRLNADGSPDPGFGDQGTVSGFFQISVQPDDKILLSGTDQVCDEHGYICTGGDSLVLRLTKDGGPDPGFGDDGLAKIDLRPFHSVRFYSTDLDSAGNIYAVGANLVARLAPDGQLDGTFGTGGIKYLVNGNGRLAVEGDHFFSLGGIVPDPSKAPIQVLAKYDLSGEPVADFGVNGIISLRQDSNGYASDPLLTKDGRITVVGTTSFGCNSWDCDFSQYLDRFTADGNPDPTWGTDGQVSTNVGFGYIDAISQTAADIGPDDKVVEAVAKNTNWNQALTRVQVVRYDTDGSLDKSFSSDGIADLPETLPACPNTDSVDGRVTWVVDGKRRAGTDRDEVLIGSDLDDDIRGRGGNDTICGHGGHNTLFGNSGTDEIYGGPGGERLNGGPGNDIVRGRAGNDSLQGKDGQDFLFGGRGHDQIRGGSGADQIFARDGRRDLVNCGPGRDVAKVDRADVVYHCEKLLRRS